MLRSYYDIISKLGSPKWFDNNGVPRYEDFVPWLCGVYVDYIAYINLRCQGCNNSFMVTVERRKFRLYPEIAQTNLPNKETGDLGDFHYGDPPRHNTDGTFHPANWDLHCVGVTMNSYPARIVEFWLKNQDHDWERDPTKEFEFREEIHET